MIYNLYIKSEYWTRTVIEMPDDLEPEKVMELCQEGEFDVKDFTVLYETEEPLRYELENEKGDVIGYW